MMTGKELIIYILTHNLEDAPILAIKEDGSIVGFMTDAEAAEKFDVGVATIGVWADMEMIEGVRIDGKVYISETAERP